ncbi:MAG: aspartyl-phosphate phosphatase Spo0E family protein [Bacillaceae bacterium]|nr:aspartyl-phosphate phosphatase Spo0E family protein [Bacillaceae bacterium]
MKEGLNSENTLKCSQELDRLLNIYQKMIIR